VRLPVLHSLLTNPDPLRISNGGIPNVGERGKKVASHELHLQHLALVMIDFDFWKEMMTNVLKGRLLGFISGS
jgi:hypothetical protein